MDLESTIAVINALLIISNDPNNNSPGRMNCQAS